jgi:hypothetical protein
LIGVIVLFTNHKGGKMKSRMKCLSVSKRNEDALDLIEEYADMWGMSDSCAIFHIVREYGKLQLKERIRELEASR